MRALLWKDYRMNRALLVVSAFVLVVPYAIGVAVQYRNAQSTGMWGGTVAAMALAAMACSLPTISLLAANAFTQERTDRSAEFLACLPPSRLSILLSKFVLAFSVAVVMWVVNLVMGLVVAPALGDFQPSLADSVRFLLPTSALVFAAGWAASTVMTSPVGAWGVATATPMVIGGILYASWYYFGVPSEGEFGSVYSVVAVITAIVVFAVSSVGYVRRVEP